MMTPSSQSAPKPVLRLQIELVLPTLCGLNLRAYLTAVRWVRLRNAVHRSADHVITTSRT